MTWYSLIDSELSGRLCLTLLHSLWQVSVLAFVVWCINQLWRNGSVERHYAVNVTALVVALLAMPITYQLTDVTEPTNSVVNESTLTTVVKKKPVSQANASKQTELVGWTNSSTYNSELKENRQTKTIITSDASMLADTPAGQSSKWLWLTPWIVALYVAGVALMFVRLVFASVRANRLRVHADLISEGPLFEALQSMSRQWSMKVVPVLARTEQIIVPKVMGIVRPTILLPASAISGLSADELEMILAHELAHVRRYDMWVNLIQRFAETVLFFNPALWYLSRRVSVLREYCCDEMTCRVQASSATSDFESRVCYATTLLRVIELAKRNTTKGVDLSALAASGRSPSEVRRRVARLFGEPIREPLQITRGAIFALFAIGFAIMLTPLVSTSTAQSTTKDPGSENKSAKEQIRKQTSVTTKDEKTTRTFQLNVVDPDENPVPHAAVVIRTNSPSIRAEQVQGGKFVRRDKYRTFVKTDAEGKLALTLPRSPKEFNIAIIQPGYTRYWAGWDSTEHPQVIPSDFTAKLDKAWAVGGVIINEAGQPIEGAKISYILELKKRQGNTKYYGMGTPIVTDAKGQWRFDHVPMSKSDIHITVSHPDFSPLRRRLPRNGFEIKESTKPIVPLELKSGLIVSGIVTDEAGEPIPGALVRTKFLNEIREAKTDEQGEYHLVGCEPRKTRVVVSAKGRATDMQEVRVEPDMAPVDFTMKPGGKIRIRVVDEQGNGIPKARIFFQRWRGRMDYFEFDNVSQFADKNGVWEWNEAPLDEFQADICRPGGMQLSKQSLIARDAEYVFKPAKVLVVSGSVVDVKTKQPIKKFRVTPGLRNSDPRIGMNWIPRDSFEASEGKYRIRLKHDYPAHLVRIEAAGYQLAISRDIKTDEGKINLDFLLEPAEDISANILTAAGKPAAKAKIALGVADSQINIKNGEIHDGSTYATQLNADADGRFSIPSGEKPFQMVITHPAGFAYLKSDDGPIPDPIKLTPWARVEGTFRIGKQTASNIALTMFSTMNQGIHSYGDDVPSIFTHHDVTTGKDGRFIFQRVFPGNGRIGRHIMLIGDEGATEVTSSIGVPGEFVAGKTTTLNLGGTGRTIIGKLAPPDNLSEKIRWSFVLIDAKRYLEPPPGTMAMEEIGRNPKQFLAWLDTWKKSADYETEKVVYQKYKDARKKLQAETPTLSASIARDGTFRIDDVPEGDYVMSVRFQNRPVGKLIHYPFSVSSDEAGQTAEPIDLGTLTLEK